MFTPFRGCSAVSATPKSKPTSHPTRSAQSGKDVRFGRMSDWQARPARLTRPESGPLFASRDHNLKLRYRLPVAALQQVCSKISLQGCSSLQPARPNAALLAKSHHPLTPLYPTCGLCTNPAANREEWDGEEAILRLPSLAKKVAVICGTASV